MNKMNSSKIYKDVGNMTKWIFYDVQTDDGEYISRFSCSFQLWSVNLSPFTSRKAPSMECRSDGACFTDQMLQCDSVHDLWVVLSHWQQRDAYQLMSDSALTSLKRVHTMTLNHRVFPLFQHSALFIPISSTLHHNQQYNRLHPPLSFPP